MGLIDSHCHLDSERFHEDRAAVVRRALEAGVELMLSIGSGDGPPDLEAAIRVAEEFPQVWATVGVHPHDAANATAETFPKLAELLSHPKVVGLGETGLDYFYDHSPRETQQAVFRRQIEIAKDARAPLIIHTRDAWPDTFEILEREWAAAGLPGIMHCFSGGPAEAERSLAMGFYLSFAGVVTFPKSEAIQEAARLAPADRILVETDSPYLAPAPYRGKRNEPAYVAETARFLGQLRGVAAEEIAAQTSANFRRLFPKAFAAN